MKQNKRNSSESVSNTDLDSVIAGDNDASPEWIDKIADNSCFIKVIFNETEDVYWEARIKITRCAHDGDIITFGMYVLDPFPEIFSETVIVSQDSPFCEFLVNVLFED